MNKRMLKEYGIFKGYDVQNETYQWAQRANIVIDKNGVVQHIEEGDSAVDPNTAMSVCTDRIKRQRSNSSNRNSSEAAQMCRLAIFLPTIQNDTDFPVWKSEYRQMTIEPRG